MSRASSAWSPPLPRCTRCVLGTLGTLGLLGISTTKPRCRPVSSAPMHPHAPPCAPLCLAPAVPAGPSACARAVQCRPSAHWQLPVDAQVTVEAEEHHFQMEEKVGYKGFNDLNPKNPTKRSMER